MRRLDLTVPHGVPWETARAHFETALVAAQNRFSRWVRHVEWSEDRTSAILSGPAYRVVLSADRERVSATGEVPIPPALMEPMIRRFLAATLG